VGAHKSFYVIGGLEVTAFFMALLTAEGILDLIVADEAIGHSWHIRRRDLNALFETAVASLAGVGPVEVPAGVARRLKVLTLVDRGGDHWCEIAHLYVLLVVEMSHVGGRRTSDLPAALMAGQTDLLVGKQIVLWLGAGCRSRVTGLAAELQLQM
jgi:hypothetical protein